MKKPTLEQYGVTKEQYLKFEEYNSLCEKRNQKINSFDDYLSFRLTYLTCIVISFSIYGDVLFYTEIALWRKALVVVFVFILPFIAFPITMLINILWGYILSLIGKGKIEYIASLLYESPIEELYFENVKLFLSQEKEYNQRIIFKDTFDKIISYEKDNIRSIVKQIEKKKQREYWLELSGISFEHEVARLYESLGYKVLVTQASGDGGVDIKMWDDKNNYIIVQCKKHTAKVGIGAARELYGTLIIEKAHKAILIGSNGFTSGVFAFVRSSSVKIELQDLDYIIKLCSSIKTNKFDDVKISNLININQEKIFSFKLIGGVYIPYTSYKRAEYDSSLRKMTLVNNNAPKGFYLFTNKEDAEKIMSEIFRLKNQPIKENYLCEIVKWTNDDYRSVFYIRIFTNENRYLKSRSTSKLIECNFKGA